MQTFSDLGASAPVVRALGRRDIRTPFPIQAMVIPDAVAGRDVLAKSRTGSGKTLAFAVPIVERLEPSDRRPSALILVPTRELAVQVVEEFNLVAGARGLSVAAVYGGVSIPAQAKRAARAHVLVATPGRMQDLVERRLVSLEGIRILVLDEADRMLDMGFQPQVDRIVRGLTADRQTMFFSATLDGTVGRLAGSYTRDARLHETVTPRQTVDEAEHRFIPVSFGQRLEHLVEIISAEPGRHLVFTRTKRGADRLTRRLRDRGIPAAAMHGDLGQALRERTLRRFERGEVNTLVATDVAARGLDVDDITHVVNYDAPEDDTGYVHRVGRTARAGRTGTGITFVLPEQQGDMSRMAARLKLEDEFTQNGMEIAPPRVVFSSSRGRRSVMGRRRR
ncbi:MAG TPA: DEAD/DEAH box helicase [Actinomycetota bacterium]|nr:DEAD/DEAH box helicase [Actinomycetota bacterium]